MSGIYPLSGPLKISVEREAASVRLQHFATITELENTISLLESQLMIAHAQRHGMRVVNEGLTDVIRSRPLSPRPSWTMPEAPVCKECSTTMTPVVYHDRGCAIGHACPECRLVRKCGNSEWPFESDIAVHQSDFERLGFHPVDEENLQADFDF
jgi:hypothetical protein